MKKKHIILIVALVALIAAGAAIEFSGIKWGNVFQISKKEETKKGETEEKVEEEVVKSYNKPQAAKEAVMEEDSATMNMYGFYFDYANMSLVEVVEAYLDEYGIDHSNVSFSYKNTDTNEVIEYNQTEPMTAGSTYKLPLNMIVVDEVEKGKLSMDERYSITDLPYEYLGEYQAYLAQFGDTMSISEMQEYSIVYSENTPAYALMSLLGGVDKAYTYFDRYGVSENEDLPTIDNESGNKTTSSYFLKVLEQLWANQEKYSDLVDFLDQAFTGEWFEEYVSTARMLQKPGYSREALNWDGVVFEESPYLLSLYTRYFGNSSEASVEIDPTGYNLVAGLGYVINEWHRVNQNPADSSYESEDDTEETSSSSKTSKSSSKTSSSKKKDSSSTETSTEDEEDVELTDEDYEAYYGEDYYE